MTQNLDLDLSTNTTYTNLDTDLGWNGTSYSTASWLPARSTYTTSSGHTHEWCIGGHWDSQSNQCSYNNTPESYDPGDLYWNETTVSYADYAVNGYANPLNNNYRYFGFPLRCLLRS